jgi:methionine biosynthesis protein MetW
MQTVVPPVQWRTIARLFLRKDKAKAETRPYADYGYPDPDVTLTNSDRPEYGYIVDWVEAGSSVLDLGCGDGSLGELLIEQKHCQVHGMDIDENGVKQALRRGVKATVGNMDAGLDFADKLFDYVVINVTLHMIYRPDFVLNEALRVGKRVIVSFPNFGHIFARMEMLFLGRYPQTTLFGYQWYNTRHIHPLSYRDFITYIKQRERPGVKVLKKEFLWLMDTRKKYLLSSLFPDLFAGTCLIFLEENGLR